MGGVDGKQTAGGERMNNRERFDNLRRRLWDLLGTVDFSDGCKSYEGAIEVHCEYPDYFFCLANNEDKPQIPEPSYYEITLHCYVLGPTRHYKFKGKTFSQALDCFEKWIVAEENRKAVEQ